MNQLSAVPAPSTPTVPIVPLPGLRERLQQVPPARIIAAEEDSGDVLTSGDLRQFAKHLAYEFSHDAASAARWPAAWYAEQVEQLTPAQAVSLRAQTIELCEEVTLYRGYNQTLLAGGGRRAEALDAFGVLLLILALFLLVPLFWHGVGQVGQ